MLLVIKKCVDYLIFTSQL